MLMSIYVYVHAYMSTCACKRMCLYVHIYERYHKYASNVSVHIVLIYVLCSMCIYMNVSISMYPMFQYI